MVHGFPFMFSWDRHVSARARTILITGCSSGCGLDAALELRERGWIVFAACRKESDCQLLRAQGFRSPRIDYRDEGSTRQGFSEVMQATGGKLDALFNNGGSAFPVAAEDVSPAAWRDFFEAMFFGWTTLTQLAVQVMRKQGERGRGVIVQHSSIFGLFAGHFHAPYCAAKAALQAYTGALRLELLDTDICLSVLNTGAIDTAIRWKAIEGYFKWVVQPGISQASPWASIYRIGLELRMMSKIEPDPTEDKPTLVTRTLIRALDAHRPSPVYYITTNTWIRGICARLLPTSLNDIVTIVGPKAPYYILLQWVMPRFAQDAAHGLYHPPPDFDPPNWDYAKGEWPHDAAPRNEFARAAQEAAKGAQ
jgi:NAD(P)-dependent dehydrogenase (short-subunit alcohol dehydrogenase family)